MIDHEYFRSLPVVVTLTDGSTIDLTNNSLSAGSNGDGKLICQKGTVFDSILPFDEIASVTVGDMVFPVE